MKPPKLPDIEKYISDKSKLISPTENSHMGYSVPEIVFKYGHKFNHLMNAPYIFPKLIKALWEARKSYKSLDNNPELNNKIASKSFLKKLKEYAFSLGCSDIGFTKVPPEYIFKNKKILFDKAIVLTLEMKRDKIKQAPNINAGKEVWRTYAELGKLVNKIAEFLRNEGFNAQPGPAIGGEVNYPLLAQKAGLGFIGKNGLLISKDNGPSQRIAVVYTDIENLQYTDTEEYNWILDFCENCNRCVRKCPANAIFKNTKVFEDGSRQHIDYKKCAVPFSDNMGCSICIKECVLFKNNYGKVKREFLAK